MTSTTLDPVRFGFVPLVDAAIPIIAYEKGFAAQQGIDLQLVPVLSWAAMRDKLAYGLLDASHLLAGIPLACALGVAGAPQIAMETLMALGRGNNSIVVSNALYQRMQQADPKAMSGPRAVSALALKKVLDADRAARRPLLSFATVFPVSSHTFELRHWLSTAGINPERDLNLGIVAPPRMVESLHYGLIDGYCVGEPWGLRAVEQGNGVVVATKSDICPAAPEKVLGVRADWRAENPTVAAALIRAFVLAARWADLPENRAELINLLSQQQYLGMPADLIQAALCGQTELGKSGDAGPDGNGHMFYRWQSTFPWLDHGRWLVAQMQRWGMWDGSHEQQEAAVRAVYRPDAYRQAVAPLGLTLPAVDHLPEEQHTEPFFIPAEGGAVIELGPNVLQSRQILDVAE